MITDETQMLVYPNVSNASKEAECMDFENKVLQCLMLDAK